MSYLALCIAWAALGLGGGAVIGLEVRQLWDR